MVESEDLENLSFNQRDIKNLVHLERHYNNDFYNANEGDDEGKLMNAFWCDPRRRAICKEFGDVVTLDTTFLYRMSFAPFGGVSHHKKSIVFKQWLNCMGKPAQAILSDQCKSIGKEVEKLFLRVPHRLCLLHILHYALNNLGKLAKWPEIKKALRAVVHDFIKLFEFNEAWGAMLEKIGVQDNVWLKDTFNIRERWALGY
ncbi:Protein FAR1-RELATED SEQUENCE 6 [Bienertia sinuspersici]